jgi:hypothetical protein
MGTVGWLIRQHVRHRSVALTALALMAALGTTATLVAAGAADRTADAYSSYLHRARVGDVVINPSLVSLEIDRTVRALPGVVSVTSDALFNAGVDAHPRPRTQAELDADPAPALVRGSTDGRYVTMDRPALTKGRLPTGRSEALVTVEFADHQHVAVGDVLPLSFWSRRTEFTGVTKAVPPVGIEHVNVVGIATLSDEVLPDGLYPRQTVIVSPDIAKRYDCVPDAPQSDAPLTDAILQLAPAGCATSYRYYSLAVRGGARGIATALRAFTVAADRLTAKLPQALQEQQVAFTLVAESTTAEEHRRVDRSTQPIVVALGVLAAAAAAITALVVGLGLARDLVRADGDQAMWWRLGVSKRERVQVLAVPLLAAVGAGLVVGTLAAWLLSPVAPVGNVRSVVPSPDRELSARTGLVALALALVFVVTVALLSWRAAGRVGTRARYHVSLAGRRFGRGSSRPQRVVGVRAAYATNRGAGLVLASGGTAVAVFVAAVVFGVSLSSLLSAPASYGWPWDVATIDNYGYGGIDLPAVRKTLDARADVDRWTALGFSNSITLDNDPVPAVLGFDRSSTVDIAVVKGRLPAARDEIALGARTAAEHGVSVGDTVKVAGYEVQARSATVTGTVVLPALGPFRADRTAPGLGILVPQAMLDPKQAPVLATFVGIKLQPDTDRGTALAELRSAFRSWDRKAIVTFDFADPVRPAEIIDARSMRNAPMLVGGLLVVGATVGLGVGIAMSVRARRRDLAILRVLGFTRRQLRDSVLVQAFANVTGSVIVGMPVGLALGRVAWRAFASRLGVVTHPSMPLGWLVGTALGAGAVALVAAAVPARAAARTQATVALRSD